MIFWVLPNSGLQTVSHLKSLLSEFEREHPDIRVELAVLTRDALWRRLFEFQRQPRRAETGDIVQIPHYWTALFARLGIIDPLPEFTPKSCLDEWIEPLRPHCLLPGSSDIYSVPWWMDVTALHYRTDHMRAVCGNGSAAFREWDDVVRICRELARKFGGGNYFPMENSNLRGSVNLRDLLPSIWSRGGDIFNTECTRAVVHREEALRGMEDYLQLLSGGHMPLLRERGSLGTMLEGRASMTVSRRLSQSLLPENDEFEVKTVPLPGGLYGAHSLLSSYNLALVKNAKNRSEAAELLKWLVRPAQQAMYCRMIHAFQPAAAEFEQFIFSSHERMRTYSEIVAGARALPNVTVCGTYVEILDSALSRIAIAVARGSYSSGMLLQEMVKVQVEMDYLLSLYGE
ncbi:MAG: extracellular solute-binding protein [Elusimicrobiales bacterium]